MLVVVPKSQLKEWTAQYEALEADDLAPLMAESGSMGARAVVPRSSTQIAEDSDSVLVSIVVLRRFVDQIKVRTGGSGGSEFIDFNSDTHFDPILGQASREKVYAARFQF